MKVIAYIICAILLILFGKVIADDSQYCYEATGEKLITTSFSGKWYTLASVSEGYEKPDLLETTLKLFADYILIISPKNQSIKSYSIKLEADYRNGYNINRTETKLYYIKQLSIYDEKGFTWRIFCGLKKSSNLKDSRIETIGYIIANTENLSRTVIRGIREKLSQRYDIFNNTKKSNILRISTAVQPESCKDAEGESLNQSSFSGEWFIVAIYGNATKSPAMTESTLILLSDNKTLKIKKFYNFSIETGNTFSYNTELIADNNNGYNINSPLNELYYIKLLSSRNDSGIEWRIFCGNQNNDSEMIGYVMANRKQVKENMIPSIHREFIEHHISLGKENGIIYSQYAAVVLTAGPQCCGKAMGKSLYQARTLGKWYNVAISKLVNSKSYFRDITVQLLSDNKTLNIYSDISDSPEKSEHKSYSINITTDPDETNGYQINSSQTNLFYFKLLSIEHENGIGLRIFCGLEKWPEPSNRSTEPIGYIMASEKIVEEAVLLDVNSRLSERYSVFHNNSYTTYFALTACNGASTKVPLFATSIAAFYTLRFVLFKKLPNF